MPENQPNNPSANAADESATQSPAAIVKELQEELKKNEEELAKQTKARDAFKSDVDALTKTIADIEKAKTDAGKSLPQIIEDRETLDKYRKDMVDAADAVLKERVPLVNAKIVEVEKMISDQADKLPAARKRVRDTEDTARTAQEDLDKKQKRYEDLKNLYKDQFKQLNDLKTRIDKLNDVPKAATMYVLLREMNTVLDVTTIPATEEEFETKLTDRWKELQKAKETARKAKLDFEDAKTQLASDETRLAALQKSRVDDLIAATDEFNK